MKTQNLSERIFQHIESTNGRIPSISLFGGIAGQILLYGYMYKEFGTKDYLDKFHEIAEEGMDLLQTYLASTQSIECTHAGGISGFFMAINHLCKIGVFQEDFDEVISEDIQQLVGLSLDIDFTTENYDPLYGFIGKGLFLISQSEKSYAQSGLESIVKTLYHSKIVDKKGNYTWVDIRNVDSFNKEDRTRIIYDCGLAHGVAGIIAFCCDAYPVIQDIDIKNTLKEMLQKATLWLLDQEQQGQMFMFPFAKFHDPEDPANRHYRSRLAWCYGDLSIAIAIYKASTVLQDTVLYEKARTIALHATTIDFSEAGIYNDEGIIDVSFCHGTCGISYIFLFMYQAYEDSALLSAYESWRDFTNSHLEERLNTASLFSALTKEREDYGLLYGYTGIALTCLSYISGKTMPWSQIILL